MVWGWVISGIVTVATIAFDYFNNKATVEQIEEAVDKLQVVYVPGMGFDQFVTDFWLYFVAFAVVAYASYRIAHPRMYRRYNKRRYRA